MMSERERGLTRRDALKVGLMGGVGLGLGRWLPSTPPLLTQNGLITRPIPSSGERVPVVGVGANRFGVQTAEEMVPLGQVLQRLAALGGEVVDTAPGYGRSEIVIGELLEEHGLRDELFLATKVSIRGEDVQEGIDQLNTSFERLKTERIDLIQVHNLRGADLLLPVLKAWKQDGRIRYYGITTSSDRQYEEMERLMGAHDLDFIQVDYSLENRTAAERILPLARDRGMAVLNNTPFGGRRGPLFSMVSGKELPTWAIEFGAESWAQFFLKYLVSHPAVTCAIPGTTDPGHMEDNLNAARGELPTPDMRQMMEAYWDAL